MNDAQTTEPVAQPFGKCGACAQRWATWKDFLDDPQLSVVGLQVAQHLPDANLLIFEHACGSSVSVRTARLRFLLSDPAGEGEFPEVLGSEECQQLCQRLEQWRTCNRPCINTRARRVLQRILRIKQRLAARSSP